MFFYFVLLLCFLFFCFCLFLFALLMYRFYRHAKSKPYSNSDSIVRITVVLGSGGHTTEALRLVGSLGSRYAERIYILADTDSTSLSRLHKTESERQDGGFGGNYSIRLIPRSREVRQSYLTSVWTTLTSLFSCLRLVNVIKPELILCNGPGTCIPVCISAYLFDLLFFRTCRIIFVESVCRVEKLSLTGKILYYLRLADVVFVQWPNILDRYPRALYLSRF